MKRSQSLVDKAARGTPMSCLRPNNPKLSASHLFTPACLSLSAAGAYCINFSQLTKLNMPCAMLHMCCLRAVSARFPRHMPLLLPQLFQHCCSHGIPLNHDPGVSGSLIAPFGDTEACIHASSAQDMYMLHKSHQLKRRLSNCFHSTIQPHSWQDASLTATSP